MKIRHIEIHNFRGIKSLTWRLNSDFICLIGAGDSCKSTILAAIDFALSPRTTISFDDSDFFDQNVEDDILIQVTLSGWDESSPEAKALFQEKKFAQYVCGLGANGPLEEPEDGIVAVSICLRVAKDLEPQWCVSRGPFDPNTEDKIKPIKASDRALFGVSRLDASSDYHFTWGRNSLLAALTAESSGDVEGVLSDLARQMRSIPLEHHEQIVVCKQVAETVRAEALEFGVRLNALAPRIDSKRQKLSGGLISLHERDIPVHGRGTGSKKLVASAMQMKSGGNRGIAIIDEIEVGLEPQRIRGLLTKLRNGKQQIFTTSHSPVVVRELTVAKDELFVCSRSEKGLVSVSSVSQVSGFQGAVRRNAEAFLGATIVVCEGATEIGCLRAYDLFRVKEGSTPVWSLATAYFDANGASNIKDSATQLRSLGYRTAALCDNDAPDQISPQDVDLLQCAGTFVAQWDADNSTEQQLLVDLPWSDIGALLALIATAHDPLELDTIIESISKLGIRGIESKEPTQWIESADARREIGALIKQRKWLKRIDLAETIFSFAFPRIAPGGTMMRKLGALSSWVQREA